MNRETRGGVGRRGAGWGVAALLVLVGWAGGAGAADPLTPGERAWLEGHGPIVFASQTDYPPFEFGGPEGRRQGMCVELARWMGCELGFPVEFRDMDFQQAQAAVEERRADVLTSLFRSEEREGRFDFTEMTWEVPAQIFVRVDRNDIVGEEDLRGKRIAMQRGDYAEEHLASKGLGHEVVPTASFAEAVARVVAGEADALIGDRPIVWHHLHARGIAGQMKAVGEPLYVGRNAMAARKGSAELMGILGKGMAKAREKGMFEVLESRWVGVPGRELASGARTRHLRTLSAVLFGATGLMALLVLWIVHLRHVVLRRTVEREEARDLRKPVVPLRPGRMILARSLLFLCLLIPVGVVANRILQRQILMPDYLELEEREAQKKLRGAMDIVRRESGHLGKTVLDWALWDDTYAFVDDRNEAYVKANLTPQLLSDQTQIDAMLFFDLQGNLIWQGVYDPFAQRPIALADFSKGALPADHILLRHGEPDQPRTGLWQTEIGPMFVASSAILPTELGGTARGTLVIGRFLRESVRKEMEIQLGASVELSNPRSPFLTAARLAMFSELAVGGTRLEETTEDLLTGHALMGDLAGDPALLIRLGLTRDIVRQGRDSARLLSFILFEFILVLLLGVVAWFTISFREALRRQAHIDAIVDARTRALRESEERWRSYVEHAPMGICIVDGAGRCLEANPAACRMTGHGAQELVGKAVGELIFPESRESFEAHLRQVMEQGTATGEYGFMLKTGERRVAAIAAVRLGEDRVLGFAEDITERRQSEEIRESLQNQLTHAQKMESIGRLAGGVAHDFNNMLGVILGFTELGLDSVAPGTPLRDGLEEIHKAATRSAELTRQLLAFARRQTVLPKDLDLNETVEGMLKMLRRLIGESIGLDWRPCAGGAPVRMDPSQLDQIMVNLCVNARDAIGDRGRIGIETGVVTFDEETCAQFPGAVLGEYVRLSVSDDGVGMDDETLAHIFEPFFSTKAEGAGTGLGLATVYGIVKQNRGFIGVQSALGKGATFAIYLPRREVAPVAAAPAAAPGRDETRHGTILLVEDEEAHLNMTCAMLAKRGYTVLAAGAPSEALRLAREHPGEIDLLLSDVVMPEMNGRELAMLVQACRPKLKCLFMSGYTADIIAHQGIIDEGVRFLQKPFSLGELEAKIRGALDGGAGA